MIKFNKGLLGGIGFILVIIMACSPISPSAAPTQKGPLSDETNQINPADDERGPQTKDAGPTSAVEQPAAAIVAEDDGQVDVAANGKPLLNDEPDRPFASYWTTDFSLHTVPYAEIFSGGVPRGGIPPIDNPKFIGLEEASEWLADQEPIFVVTVNGLTRGYPLQILTWHEIVNDELGGEPITVTYCPLCNSAITFKRTLDGTVYDFGVSGNLRNSDLIMWDRQTQSWWQQLTGEAIVGELVGKQLAIIPTQLVSFSAFKAQFPEAEVLSRQTGHGRPYGQNPYAGYDSNPRPFLFAGEPDPRLSATDRVVAVDHDGEFVAYPYKILSEAHVINDTVGGEAVVVFWESGTTSALDQGSIAGSKDVGAATVYSPMADDQMLTFHWDGAAFVDDQTSSRWNILGQASSGQLAGTQLEPIIHANHLWFAWAAFRPDTRIYSP